MLSDSAGKHLGQALVDTRYLARKLLYNCRISCFTWSNEQLRSQQRPLSREVRKHNTTNGPNDRAVRSLQRSWITDLATSGLLKRAEELDRIWYCRKQEKRANPIKLYQIDTTCNACQDACRAPAGPRIWLGGLHHLEMTLTCTQSMPGVYNRDRNDDSRGLRAMAGLPQTR